jgi:CDP-diglyceride synthetase
MQLILQLIWLTLPLVIAGLVHLWVLKRDLLPGLRQRPIDGGACFRGRRVFGDNKTWRGALVMILTASIAAGLLAALDDCCLGLEPLVPFAAQHPFAWGALLGTGYIAGELPNSFVKRQLGIAPGAMGQGLTGRVFWVVDQLDSLAGMLLFAWPVWQPSATMIVLLAALMLIGHPIGALIMMLFGLKDRIG